mmetsp:Transcript_77483/g.153846  ORF Transcript_77483/g.153846 Transcript_77483/m.153846 type:complete len:259 (+) Transcript_77483:2147-2923(+)
MSVVLPSPMAAAVVASPVLFAAVREQKVNLLLALEVGERHLVCNQHARARGLGGLAERREEAVIESVVVEPCKLVRTDIVRYCICCQLRHKVLEHAEGKGGELPRLELGQIEGALQVEDLQPRGFGRIAAVKVVLRSLFMQLLDHLAPLDAVLHAHHGLDAIHVHRRHHVKLLIRARLHEFSIVGCRRHLKVAHEGCHRRAVDQHGGRHDNHRQEEHHVRLVTAVEACVTLVYPLACRLPQPPHVLIIHGVIDGEAEG